MNGFRYELARDERWGTGWILGKRGEWPNRELLTNPVEFRPNLHPLTVVEVTLDAVNALQRLADMPDAFRARMRDCRSLEEIQALWAEVPDA